MTKHSRKSDKSKELEHLNLDTKNTASSMDCTGLIPSALKTKAEEEFYEELYKYRADAGQEQGKVGDWRG